MTQLFDVIRRFRERLAYIFLEADPVHLAGLSGTIATLWGLILLIPSSTFSTGRGYALMGELFPEWIWGGSVALVGVLQVASTITGSLRGRLVISACMCAVWLFITIMFFVSNPISTATAVYPVLAFASFITVYQRLAAYKGEQHARASKDDAS